MHPYKKSLWQKNTKILKNVTKKPENVTKQPKTCNNNVTKVMENEKTVLKKKDLNWEDWEGGA